MSAHSFFAPSKAHMWMECPGSLAMPENQVEGGSSDFADNGTASHILQEWALRNGKDCYEYPDKEIIVNGKPYPVDDERCDYVQSVVDDVRRRAMGGTLWCEYKVDLSEFMGEGQGGTSDVVILQPMLEEITCCDLKYGTGEKVYACYGDESLPPHKRINKQGGLYLVGAVRDAEMIGFRPKKCRFVIHQPRLNWIDEFEISYEELMLFAGMAQKAVEECGHAMVLSPDSPDLMFYLKPGDKTCRWCQAKARCPKLAQFVQDQIRADFDTVLAEPPMVPRSNLDLLAKAYRAVPLVEDWCRAVKAEVWTRVQAGEQVIGVDGKPMKIVEGDEGKRVWKDTAAAEAALLGQLPEDKVYEPRKIITAPAAAKILDKKKTRAIWEDVFKPLIERKRGAPQLALGSDPRPPYTGAAKADEFADAISADLTE